MKAVILNSGYGSRMGEFTKTNHKSMVEIFDNKMLIIYQIEILASCGITDFIITTGHLDQLLEKTILDEFKDKYNFTFVLNSKYKETNYIYSLNLVEEINDDILLLHGDLYFDKETLLNLIASSNSSVVVDTTLPQPEKDFKARIIDGKVMEVATYIHDSNCYSLQPLYKLLKDDFSNWKNSINKFCNEGNVKVYAEEALNVLLKQDEIILYPLDLKGRLCMEVDTIEDLDLLKQKLQ